MIRRHPDAVPYQSTQLTERAPERLLEDLAALEVTGAHVSERGSTYLVFTPVEPHPYTASLAVTLAIILAIVDLIATAWSVVVIALLPLALVPFVPLLVSDRPQVAVGAVPGENEAHATRVTVHGRVWGDLGAALDAYLSHLPAGATAPARDGVAEASETGDSGMKD